MTTFPEMCVGKIRNLSLIISLIWNFINVKKTYRYCLSHYVLLYVYDITENSYYYMLLSIRKINQVSCVLCVSIIPGNYHISWNDIGRVNMWHANILWDIIVYRDTEVISLESISANKHPQDSTYFPSGSQARLNLDRPVTTFSRERRSRAKGKQIESVGKKDQIDSRYAQ